MIIDHHYLFRRREQGEWDNPFQPEGEVSQDAEVCLYLYLYLYFLQRCVCICIFCIFISPISPMHFSQVIVQLWKGGRLCQDSLAADLAAAARWYI